MTVVSCDAKDVRKLLPLMMILAGCGSTAQATLASPPTMPITAPTVLCERTVDGVCTQRVEDTVPPTVTPRPTWGVTTTNAALTTDGYLGYLHVYGPPGMSDEMALQEAQRDCALLKEGDPLQNILNGWAKVVIDPVLRDKFINITLLGIKTFCPELQ